MAKVTVLTTVYSSWRAIHSDYNEFKRVYEQKYGHPDVDYHFFSSPYELGDGYETTAVKLNKCYYTMLLTRKAIDRKRLNPNYAAAEMQAEQAEKRNALLATGLLAGIAASVFSIIRRSARGMFGSI